MASKAWAVKNESERGKKQHWQNLRYYPNTCLEIWRLPVFWSRFELYTSQTQARSETI
jgi:hypothetical protein